MVKKTGNGEQGQIMNHDQKNCRPLLAQFLEVLKIAVFLKSAWKWKRLVFSSNRQWIFTRGASISVASPWITEISGQKWNIGVSCKSREHFKSQKVYFYEAPSSATKGALNGVVHILCFVFPPLPKQILHMILREKVLEYCWIVQDSEKKGHTSVWTI